MAPPDYPANSNFRVHKSSERCDLLELVDGELCVKESTFDAIAYVHVFENPYNLMKEAYRAIRIHLDTFKLLEEKSVPPLINKFGWCTWDAFYMIVEPAGIWHGVIEFSDGGLSLRFLIIDDGSQNVNFDGKNPNENAFLEVFKRLSSFRFDECEKCKKSGSMLGSNSPPFDPKKPKMLNSKAHKIDSTAEARNNSIWDHWFVLRVMPGTTHLDTKIVPCKLSPGLGGTMEDFAVVKIVKGSLDLSILIKPKNSMTRCTLTFLGSRIIVA
ncbi:stachyose synthase-like [Olea europaea subsp. europaea]|uniref:Stachyose synthase-like n=1 Tax=Olea europaea subsp. europaea TaxID=158383 RepID=A0A8S0QHA1_OLEEU|nr:stachyose synthase-like [Olea europaea subsp. europaea]